MKSDGCEVFFSLFCHLVEVVVVGSRFCVVKTHMMHLKHTWSSVFFSDILEAFRLFSVFVLVKSEKPGALSVGNLIQFQIDGKVPPASTNCRRRRQSVWESNCNVVLAK